MSRVFYPADHTDLVGISTLFSPRIGHGLARIFCFTQVTQDSGWVISVMAGKFQPEPLGFLLMLSLQPFGLCAKVDNTLAPAPFKFQESLIIVVLLLLEL